MTAFMAVPQGDVLAWPEERARLIVEYLDRREDAGVSGMQRLLVIAVDRCGEVLAHGRLVEAAAPDHQVVRATRVHPVRLALRRGVEAEEREKSVVAHSVHLLYVRQA